MPGRPRRSCDSCNAQKLRCCGQKPICERCRRLGRPCVYTPTKNHSRAGPAPSPLSSTPSAPAEPTISRLHEPDKRYFGIPSELLPTLIDLYFTHLYNAHLLFHRPSLVCALESDAIRLDVLLSICALASKFYIDPKGSPILVDSQFSHEWAEAASRIAFREVESPCQDNIVVFLNLSLFWYSVGQFQRSVVHSACAANTSWILGNPPDRQGKESPLEAEIRRRRFWACYLLCTFQTDSLFPKVPTETMLNMRLPYNDHDFQLGNPQQGVSLKSSKGTQSIYAELVRAMALWSSVVALIKQPDSGLSNRLVEIQALDSRIHQTWAQLSGYFHLDPANLTSVSPHDLPRLLLLHIIYHQCLCSLHSSIVPLFSWSSCDDTFAYPQQLSAQTAFEHANAVSHLLDAALSLEWDARSMPSFIGYAAYCACAIQTPFLWCSKSDIRQRAVCNLLANLKTLQILSHSWAFLKILGRYACGLYKVHATRPFPLTDEPKNMTPVAMKGFNATNSRARLSILAHNSIMTSDQGSVARGEDDIGDLGLVGSESRGIGLAEDENIAGVMSQISSEARVAANNQLPIIMDPFVSSENMDFYDLDGTVDLSTEGSHMDQLGHIEDWISELMQQEV